MKVIDHEIIIIKYKLLFIRLFCILNLSLILPGYFTGSQPVFNNNLTVLRSAVVLLIIAYFIISFKGKFLLKANDYLILTASSLINAFHFYLILNNIHHFESYIIPAVIFIISAYVIGSGRLSLLFIIINLFLFISATLFNTHIDNNHKITLLSIMLFIYALCITSKIILVLSRKEENKIRIKYDFLFNSSRDIIFLCCIKDNLKPHIIIDSNKTARKLLDYNNEEICKITFEEIIYIDNKDEFYQSFYNKIKDGSEFIFESFTINKTGHLLPSEIFCRLIKTEKSEFILTVAKDISEKKKAEAEIRYYAYHDFLTGLPNRALLLENLKLEIAHAKRNSTLIALLFLDLNRFKFINDTFGHETGDNLLIEISVKLKKLLRDSDIIARYGGDEFIIVLPDIKDKKSIDIIADRVYETISDIDEIDGKKIYISSSIGISVFPNDTANENTLIRFADIAMFNAKKNKDIKYLLFDNDMESSNKYRLIIESSIKKIFKNNELEIHYQPIININKNEIEGFEALIYWRHPELGLLTPDRYFMVAEELGILYEIDKWVLKKVLEKMQYIKNKYCRQYRFCVNLSAFNFQDKQYPDFFKNLIKQYDIESSFLELEITESIFIGHEEYMINIMNNLKDTGVRLSIDDFGKGYSSLSYLLNFPVDTLKIDREFIYYINKNKKINHILKSVIDLAKNLLLEIIIEGVENEEQLNSIREYGCEKAQGYYFSKPMNEESLEKIIKENCGK